jgi:predicted transcriptional regulator
MPPVAVGGICVGLLRENGIWHLHFGRRQQDDRLASLVRPRPADVGAVLSKAGRRPVDRFDGRYRGVAANPLELEGPMPDLSTSTEGTLTTVAIRIVRAYAANNHVPPSGLPKLIEDVHGTLDSLHKAPKPAVSRPSAAEIRASVTPDALISFIDGGRYKTLKRHLSTHGLSPMTYRKRYGLPDTYPMVAPDYREERARIAKSIGLGWTRGK